MPRLAALAILAGWLSASSAAAQGQSVAVTLRHVDSGLCLSVIGNARDNGAAVLLLPCDRARHSQSFDLVIDDDGLFRIRPQHSGLALSVSYESTADGAAVSQWAFGGRDHERWEIELNPTTREAVLRAQHSRGCLGTAPGAGDAGAVVQRSCAFEDAGVRWRLDAIDG